MNRLLAKLGAALIVAVMVLAMVVAPAVAKNHVVCVHGYTGSGSNFSSLHTYLRIQGWSSSQLHAITYQNPYDASANVSNANQLRNFVNNVRSTYGVSKVDLVAHSMGGLSSRYYLRELGGHNNVGAMVTLGTPHYGVLLGPGDLSSISSFLRNLNSGDLTPGSVNYTSIRSSADLLVPESSAYISGWNNIRVHLIGHLGLLTSSTVHRHVRDNLTR